MNPAFYYSPVFLEHAPPDYHPENPSRLKAILDAVKNDADLNKIPIKEPRQATKEELSLNHTTAHIEAMASLTGSGYIDADTYYSPRSYEAAALAAGAGLDGLDNILSKEKDVNFCLTRPPGHHAEKDSAMGFCLFNNAAVCASYGLVKGIKRIAIFDWDVHHGNGSQHSFYSTDKVLYASIHQFPHFPGTGTIEETGQAEGRGFTINIPYPSQATDADYKLAMDTVILPVLQSYDPDVLIISAGYDSHKKDPLGGFCLSENAYAYMSLALKALNKPVILFLEGGYDLESLSASALKTFKVLSDNLIEEPLIREKPVFEPVIEKVIKNQKDFWSL